MTLTADEGSVLVKLARESIAHYLQTKIIDVAFPNISEALRQPSGVFVTLRNRKLGRELRGCIGFPYPNEPLSVATANAAVASATDDARFSSVSLEELLNEITVEVTVLGKFDVLSPGSRRDLKSMVEVGRHGILIECGSSSGILLPQVATDYNLSSETFLAHACIKAGLMPDAWLQNDVTVKVFDGQIFEEAYPDGPVQRRALTAPEL
jgi:uncharacterized protein (TIGR00296 family)